MARYRRKWNKPLIDEPHYTPATPSTPVTPTPAPSLSGKMTIDYYTYDQYIQAALHGQGNQLNAKDSDRSSRNPKPDQHKWFATKSWSECTGLVENGWPEGREQVGRILSEIQTSESEITKPQVFWDVEGDMVDIGKYVSGEPECMIRWQDAPTEKRVAKILFNISVSGAVSTEVMQWRGATVLALIDRLEQTGVRCQVDICFATRGSGHQWLRIANVKMADEILHLDRLAFHLAHPSSLRRVMFSLSENAPKEICEAHGCYGIHGGYGMPIQDVNGLLPADNRYDLVVPGMHLYSASEAVKMVEQMFQTVCPDIPQTSLDGLIS